MNDLVVWRGHLRKLTAFPVVPVITGVSVYTVWENDLTMAIVALTADASVPSGTISIAHPSRVKLADLMRAFAAQEGRPCRLISRALAIGLLAAKDC